MIHPLLNPDSKHYESKEKPVIWYIEKELTAQEAIGWCKASIMKYNMRLETKGQKESDLKKIETYKAYKKFLETLQYCDQIIQNRSVRHIIDTVIDEDIEYSL